MAEGGRRSGKTTGALVPKVIVCMLVFPGKIGETMSPTYRQANNIRTALLRHTPRSWWAKWPQPKTPPVIMTMVHGSEAHLLSADNEDAARSQGAAWGAYDERQDIPESSFMNAFLSTSEGGEDYVIFETATIKPSLREHHDRLTQSPSGAVYSMDSFKNPFIDHAFLRDASEFIDSEMLDMELRAKWPQLVGQIYKTFDFDRHVRSFDPELDVTPVELHNRFGGVIPQHVNAPLWFLSVDPPFTAAIWKLLKGGGLHLIHEVIAGIDGVSVPDVLHLARLCQHLTNGKGIVVSDPHDTKWDHDVTRYFKGAGFRVLSMRKVAPEYRITSVRAQFERDRLFVDPRCVHAIEVLEKHQYQDGHPGEPDKQTKYKRAYQRQSRSYQLVHLADAIGYGVYKLHPAKYDYEAKEKRAA